MFGLIVILFCLAVPNLVISDGDPGEQPALTCPPNEVVNKCANALCKREYCREIGQAVICAFVDHCEPGCNCREGYLRTNSEKCIPEIECPPPALPHGSEEEKAQA